MTKLRAFYLFSLGGSLAFVCAFAAFCIAEANPLPLNVGPEKVVLKIDRPWLYIGGCAVVRVTESEWERLVESYPPECLKNTDHSQPLSFRVVKE